MSDEYGMVYAYTRRESDKDIKLGPGGWRAPEMIAARAIRDANIVRLTAEGYTGAEIFKMYGRCYSKGTVSVVRRKLNLDVSHFKTPIKLICKRGHPRTPGVECNPCAVVRWHEARCKCHPRQNIPHCSTCRC